MKGKSIGVSPEVSNKLSELEKQLNTMQLQFQVIWDRISENLTATEGNELRTERDTAVVVEGIRPSIDDQFLSTLDEMFMRNDLPKLKELLAEFEKYLIRKGLRRTGWNKSKLAKELAISRASLINKVDKYELAKRKLLL